ncbi:translation initiation factor IF-2 associated domain-containing protein, partial [Methylobacterium oryzihabitans]
MSETKNPGDKTLHAGPSKTLSTKRPIEQGVVRQSFSHGRSKSVVVETVKRRVGGASPAPAAPKEAAGSAPAQSRPSRPAERQGPARSGVVLRTLSDQEQSARLAALADARRREDDDRRRAAEEAERRAAEEASRAAPPAPAPAAAAPAAPAAPEAAPAARPAATPRPAGAPAGPRPAAAAGRAG